MSIMDSYRELGWIERPIFECDLTLSEFGQQCLSDGRFLTELEICGILGDVLTSISTLPIASVNVCDICGDFLHPARP